MVKCTSCDQEKNEFVCGLCFECSEKMDDHLIGDEDE